MEVRKSGRFKTGMYLSRFPFLLSNKTLSLHHGLRIHAPPGFYRNATTWNVLPAPSPSASMEAPHTSTFDKTDHLTSAQIAFGMKLYVLHEEDS
ncbi:hypothetical protein CC2G_014482 [Coprinopsis cinerea AmutBmut pab1-1]|nr:hypothetical protein CC2G_014482 [Coprinopsis cinerea AmutBmut pab1-1]